MIGKPRILAVDFGTWHVRVMDIVSGKRGPVITHYGEFDCPPAPPEQRADILRTEGSRFFRTQPGKRALISMPGRGILIRGITVPKIPLSKLHDILKYEIQQQIPFPIEVVAWAYQIIAETEKNFNILLCAAKKDLVNDYLTRFHPFNIAAEHLDTDFFAIYNLLRFSPYFDNEKCQAILEVGAQTSNLIINYQDKILMRSLTTSGDGLTTSLAEAEKIEFSEAEKLKIEHGTSQPLMPSLLESLQTELQNSIDYWRFTLKGPEINDLYLCGGMTRMSGYKEFFEAKIKTKVNILNPLEFIEVSPQCQEAIKGKGPELAALCGIALRNLRETVIDIDMIPVEMTRMREFGENRPYIFFSSVLAVLLTLTPAFFLTQEKIGLQNFRREIQTSLSQYEKYKPDVDKLTGSISSINGNVEVVKGLFEKKYLWLARILEIGNSLPSNRIYLNTITPAGGSGPVSQSQSAAPARTRTPAGPPGGGGPPGAPPRPSGVPPVAAPLAPAQQVSAPPPSGNLPERIDVLTLNGEVIVTDIKSAFNDLEFFVQKLSQLEFFSSVTINSCELDRENNLLQFVLVLKLK